MQHTIESIALLARLQSTGRTPGKRNGAVITVGQSSIYAQVDHATKAITWYVNGSHRDAEWVQRVVLGPATELPPAPPPNPFKAVFDAEGNCIAMLPLP
jgi:hypothetical protein